MVIDANLLLGLLIGLGAGVWIGFLVFKLIEWINNQ